MHPRESRDDEYPRKDFRHPFRSEGIPDPLFFQERFVEVVAEKLLRPVPEAVLLAKESLSDDQPERPGNTGQALQSSGVVVVSVAENDVVRSRQIDIQASGVPDKRAGLPGIENDPASVFLDEERESVFMVQREVLSRRIFDQRRDSQHGPPSDTLPVSFVASVSGLTVPGMP